MPTVVITGTNRGLGFEFVKQYAADGCVCSRPAAIQRRPIASGGFDTLTFITCQYWRAALSRSQQNQSLAIATAKPKRLQESLYWVNVSVPHDLFAYIEGYYNH